jgi:hypothetical protein
MALPEITGDLAGMAGASPKTVATISFLRLYEKYWDNMATNPDFIIDRGTAALIIACPEEEQRNRIWQSYIDEKAKTNEVNASVIAVGKMYTYMSDAMGLYEKSTGAW